MLKRIYLLLLPVFVLMFIIDCKEMSFPLTAPSTYTYVDAVGEHTRPILPESLNKQSDRKIKNAMRIKAWDGSFAITFSNYCDSYCPIVYTNRPIFFSNNTKLVEQICFLYSLRGPPENCADRSKFSHEELPVTMCRNKSIHLLFKTA